MRLKEFINETGTKRGPNLNIRQLAPAVVADFKSGLTLTQIGYKYKLHNVTLRNMLRWSLGDEFQQIMDYRYGKGIGQPKNLAPETIQAMAQAYAKGYSAPALAKQFGLSNTNVLKNLQKLPDWKAIQTKNRMNQHLSKNPIDLYLKDMNKKIK